MGFLNALDISGSGLTAQKMRIDILAQNIANAETTRTENGDPYRRQMVVFQEDTGSSASRFSSYLQQARENQNPGVKVVEIVQDESDLKPVYDPGHPDANEEGYVMYPNVNKIKEMSDLLSASRAYEGNVTVINAIKSMASTALQIGR